MNLKTSLVSEADVKHALTSATTHWVNTTKEGRDLWDESCNDLNIGDLACGSAFKSAELLAALRERGLEYVDCQTGDCESALSYDEVLVDENELLEQAPEAL